jgi:hypothetical protein
MIKLYKNQFNKKLIGTNLVIIFLFNSIIFFSNPLEKQYIWEGSLVNPIKSQTISNSLDLVITDEVLINLNSSQSLIKCGKIDNRASFYEVNVTGTSLRCRVSQDSDWNFFPIKKELAIGLGTYPSSRIQNPVDLNLNNLVKILLINVLLFAFINLIIYQMIYLNNRNKKGNSRKLNVLINILFVIVFIYAGNFTLLNSYNKFFEVRGTKSLGAYEFDLIGDCKRSSFKFTTRIYPHLIEDKSIFMGQSIPFIVDSRQGEIKIQIPSESDIDLISIPFKYDYKTNFKLDIEIYNKKEIIVYVDQKSIFSENLPSPSIDLERIVALTKPAVSHSEIKGFVSLNCQKFPYSISSKLLIFKIFLLALLLPYLIYYLILISRNNKF